MKRNLVKILLALVVLLVVAIVVVGFSLDGMVKRGVETVGPRLTKVDIKLDKVGLSLFSGSGSIDGLLVGNPSGFKTPQAILMSNASVVLSPGSLFSPKIVVKSIKVVAPDITFETGAGGSNLKKILDSVNEATGGGGGGAKPAAQPQAANSGKALQVDDFLLTGAKLHLSITGVGSATVPLPEIHLTHLGQGEAGITPAELTRLVLSAIEQAAVKAAANNASAIAKGATGVLNRMTGTNGTAGKINKNISDLFKK